MLLPTGQKEKVTDAAGEEVIGMGCFLTGFPNKGVCRKPFG